MIHAVLTWSCAYLAIGALLVQVALCDDDYYESLSAQHSMYHIALIGLIVTVVWLPAAIVIVIGKAVRR